MVKKAPTTMSLHRDYFKSTNVTGNGKMHQGSFIACVGQANAELASQLFCFVTPRSHHEPGYLDTSSCNISNKYCHHIGNHIM